MIFEYKNFQFFQKNTLKSLLYKMTFFLSLINFIVCAKFNPEYENSQVLLLYIAGIRAFQLADNPYSLTTIMTNERGAADLDGIGNEASFAYISSIYNYNDNLYILDNTRRVYPKLKMLDPSIKKITTISMLNTGNKVILDMELTIDGHFFLSNDRFFYYSNMDELGKGSPSKTITFSYIQNENFNFKKLRVDTNKKNIYILNNCKLYKISYIDLPSVITLGNSNYIYTYPGCSFDSGVYDPINSFSTDNNENIYISKGGSLQKFNPSTGSTNKIYSNDNEYQYAQINFFYNNKNDIYLVGQNKKVGNFSEISSYLKSRLYKLNLSSLKVNLIAGGVTSPSKFDSKDGIGTFSGFSQIISMTFDKNDSFYFIDNKNDYNSINSNLIQKVRIGTKQ